MRGRATAIIIASTTEAGVTISLHSGSSTLTTRSPTERRRAASSRASVMTKPSPAGVTVPWTKSSGARSERDSPRRAYVASMISSRDGHPSGADHASSNGAPLAALDEPATTRPADVASAYARARIPIRLPSNRRRRGTSRLPATIDGDRSARRGKCRSRRTGASHVPSPIVLTSQPRVLVRAESVSRRASNVGQKGLLARVGVSHPRRGCHEVRRRHSSLAGRRSSPLRVHAYGRRRRWRRLDALRERGPGPARRWRGVSLYEHDG